MISPELPYHVRYLASELASRKVKNPRYSLRAFAHFLGVDPSALSRILNSKEEMALPTCIRIVKRLKIKNGDRQVFILSAAEDKVYRTREKFVNALNFSKIRIIPQPTIILSSDLVYILDREGRYLYSNSRGAIALGLSPDHIIGKTEQELGFPPATVAALSAQLAESFESGSHRGRWTRFQALHGLEHYERILTPIFGKDVQIDAVLANLHKIA